MEEKERGTLYWTSFWILIAGAANYLVVGMFGFDMLQWASAGVTLVARLLYLLVGTAGLYVAWHASANLRARSSPHTQPV